MIKGSNKRFNKLFYPIMIEQFFFMLMSQIDVLMLAGIGLSTVAAVGLANQVLMIVTFVITIIHVGASIRLIHSKEKSTLNIKMDITRTLLFNLITTVILTICVIFFIDNIMKLLHIPEDVYRVTKLFALVLLLMNFVHTTNMLMGTILRILEKAKYVTYISILMSSINIILNAYILYFSDGYFDDPIVMVAWATNISRVIGLILLFMLIKKYIVIVKIKEFNRKFFQDVIKLGLPSAGENISYNFSQLILTALIASVGTLAISSKLLTQSLSGFAFTFAISFAMANQIFLGKYIVKHKYTILNIVVKKHIKITCIISFLIVFSIVTIFLFVGKSYFSAEAYTVILFLMLLSLFLEPLRAINVFLVYVLNVLGDVKYPVSINIVVTWILLIPGAFVGINILNLGVIIVFVLMILDELIRAILMYRRFMNKSWTDSIQKIGV